MTPETEAQLLRDMGEVRGFMEQSVHLRQEDRDRRTERQASVDARFGALEADMKAVKANVNEWRVVVKVLKVLAGVVLCIITFRFGDIKELFAQ